MGRRCGVSKMVDKLSVGGIPMLFFLGIVGMVILTS